MTARRLTGAAPALTALAIVASLSACAETTVDPARTTSPPTARSATPTTVFAPAGPAIELLPELSTELSRLSALIVDDAGADEALARIEALWRGVRDEVGSTRADLVDGFEAAIQLARTSVERRRPADADKAFNNLSALVDAYVGDG